MYRIHGHDLSPSSQAAHMVQWSFSLFLLLVFSPNWCFLLSFILLVPFSQLVFPSFFFDLDTTHHIFLLSFSFLFSLFFLSLVLPRSGFSTLSLFSFFFSLLSFIYFFFLRASFFSQLILLLLLFLSLRWLLLLASSRWFLLSTSSSSSSSHGDGRDDRALITKLELQFGLWFTFRLG